MWGAGVTLGTATLAAEESLKGLTAEVGLPQPPQQDLHLRVNLHPSVCHRHAMSKAWWPWNTKELLLETCSLTCPDVSLSTPNHPPTFHAQPLSGPQDHTQNTTEQIVGEKALSKFLKFPRVSALHFEV